MTRHNLSLLIICISFLMLYSCVRKPKSALTRGTERLSNSSYLYLRKGKPFGILRVECKDCELVYSMNNKKFTMNIKEGNEDRFIYPKANSSLKTVLTSNANQMIRILAINPNGKVVSNVLETFLSAQHSSNTYSMKYSRFKNTVVVDILKSKH